MARKQFGYWTEAKLKELNRLYKKWPIIKVCQYYGKPPEVITAAYDFYQKHKALKIEVRKEKIGRRSIKVTYYKAAHAEGAARHDCDD